MNKSTTSATVLLVHGAFAESSSWGPVIDRLHAAGLTAVAVANPLRSVTTDAAYVRDVIAATPGPIVLVGHSYGGCVITEAAADNDAVKALVYVGAFAPEHGENAFELSMKFPGSSLGQALTAYPLATGGNELVIRQDVFHQQFAADVPAELAARMKVTQRPVTEAALTEPLPTNNPAWRTRRSAFVFGDLDLNIPAELQRFMAERAGATDVREVPGASHALTLSAPDVVAETILAVVEAAA